MRWWNSAKAGEIAPRSRGSRLAACAGLLCLLAFGGCRDPEPRQVAGAEPARGRDLVRGYGCHSCHLIPGVRGADGLVGPPLIRWRDRVYIAGHIPNTPDNLVLWIMNPQEFHEQTVMPNMGVTEPDARDIAAYLYTLR